MSHTSRHEPVRPIWLCARCGAPWPCGTAKLALLDEYRDNKTALTMYLVMQMEEARKSLAKLDSGKEPDDLTDRFLNWTRTREV